MKKTRLIASTLLFAAVLLPVIAALVQSPGRASAANECPANVTNVVTWTYSSGYCTGVFVASSTWSVPSGVTSFDYLLVGGGGGGATGSNALAGNGGSVVTATGRSVTGGSSVTVTVGAGGGSGAAGSSSSLVWTGNTITASGGSGGAHSGNGADGTSNSLTGSSVIYGSSGGQGNNAGPVRAGGSGAGAGAQGPVGNCTGGIAGTANRGGGGGGGATCDYGGFTSPTVSGSGGSGIAVVKYVVFAVSSFTTAQSSPTNSSSFSYTLTFNSNADATTITSADFSNAGTSTGCSFSVSPTTGATTTFTVTVSSCADGTVIPRLAASSVTSSGGVTGPGSASDGTTVTVDGTAPSAPGAADLAAASDTGTSNTDNITSSTSAVVSATGGTNGDTMTVSAVNGGTTKSCTYVIGSATSCTISGLTAGTWATSATLTDPAGNVSAAGGTTNITVDTTAPSAPTAPDVAAASDTGSSSTDNVTNDTTPTVSVPEGITGDIVTISAVNGGTTKTCTYTVGSATSCDLPVLSAGSWTLSATLTDPAGNVSTASPTTALTVDTTAPSVPGSAPDLLAASDTGNSSTDNLTGDSTPAVSGSGGSAGETVTITATNGGTTKTCTYVVGSATSCDLPALTDGTWSVTSTLTDPAGNVSGSSAALSMTVDTASPGTPSAAPDLTAATDSGTSSTDNITSSTTPAFSLSGGTSGDLATVTATNGGTTKTCTYTIGSGSSCALSGLTDGSWSVTGTLTDPSGNVSPSSSALSMTVDTTAPSAPSVPDLTAGTDSGSSSTDNITSSTSPAFSVTGGSNGDTATVTATKGGTTKTCTYVIGSATDCALSGLTDGTWSVTSTLTDPAGNVSGSSAALSMTVDTTAPSAPGSAPDLLAASDTGSSNTDNRTLDTTPAVSGAGGSAGETVTITATNGGTTKTCTYVVGSATSCDLPALTDGTWSVTSTLTDPAGNTSTPSAALSLVVDASAPSAPSAPDLAGASDTGSSSTDDVTNDSTPTVSVTGGSAGDTVTITATNGGTTKTCTYVIGSATSCDLPALTDGTWSLTGTLTDTAGNVSGPSAALSMTVDTAAPAPAMVDLIPASDLGTSSSDDLTSDPAPAVSVPGLSTGDTVTVTATNGGTTKTCTYVVGVATSCDLPALTDGTWSLTASIIDVAGNVGATQGSLSLQIDATPPAAPSAPDLLAASDTGPSSSDNVTNDTTPALSAAGGWNGDIVTLTATNGSTTASCSYTVGSAASCDLPALADGTWSVTATFTDPAGNVSPAGPAFSFVLDATPPPVTGMADLSTASDSGKSNNDNVTAVTTPRIDVPGVVAGDAVTVSATNGPVTVTCTFVASVTVTGCDLPSLTDGTWSVTVTSADSLGNTSTPSAALALTIDTSRPFGAPAATGSPSASATTTTTTTAPTVNASPSKGSTAKRKPAVPTTTTVPPSGSPVGAPDLSPSSDTGVSSYDNITNDSTPLVNVPGLSAGDAVTVKAVKGTVTVTCAYVVVDAASGCDLAIPEDGTWTVSAHVEDAAGNEGDSPSALSITVDTRAVATRPVITGISNQFVSVASVRNGSLVVVTASYGGKTATCTYTVSDTVNGCALDGLSPGEWTVSAAATDAAGNATPVQQPATLVIEQPVAPTTVPSPTTTETPADPAGSATPDGTPAAPAGGGADPLRLIASALVLLAAARRRRDDGPQRMSDDERESSGVAEYAAGSGSGGLDTRADAYRAPALDRIDLGLLRLANRSARLSPALGRTLDDGTYLRALFGVFWLVLPVAGIVAGVLAARDTAFVVAMPGLGLMVALLVIGSLDALAGLAAAISYGAAMLVGGGLDSSDAFRGLFGMGVFMFSVALVASAMRPFRRTTDEDHRWNRFADFVHIPLFGAWAAGTMFQAVPYLSGYEARAASGLRVVEWTAVSVLALRWVLENTARVLVATRLAFIENETLPDPPEQQQLASKVLRAALFAFVAVVFVGNNWSLWTGTLLFVVPKFVEQTVHRFPSFPGAYRWVPRNVTRIVLMFLVMLWWGSLVSDHVSGDQEAGWALVLMSIPGLVLGAVDWVVRDGEEWPSTILSRVLGVGVYVLGFALVRGWVL